MAVDLLARALALQPSLLNDVDEAATGITQSVHDQDSFELRGLCGDSDL